MKHLIMGTAGHVDHGKTALIKALTGIDCDTHKQEKERGITINLGFSHLDLPSGTSIGIIDVPGHKNLVKTMVAGAFGIDFVLLVIAADSGIMPQTIEHLNIIEMLGVKKGIIALTKIDLVDEETLELAELEIIEYLEGTSLENAPIVSVSAVTGQGLGELIEHITSIIPEIPEKEKGDFFRMYIDRIFNITGIGYVVTGSVMNGEAETGQELFLLPGTRKKTKIKSIERHGEQVKKIFCGDRAAINLYGLKIDDFKRGMVLSDIHINETRVVDALLSLFDISAQLGMWSTVIFHSGTIECMAKIHLLDKRDLKPKNKAIVQIHLDKPAILQKKDKFIIRNTSNDLTLGGGVIFDTSPLHHKRRTPKLIESLNEVITATLYSLSLFEMAKNELKRKMKPLLSDDLAKKINADEKEIIREFKENRGNGVQLYYIDGKYIFIYAQTDKENYDKIIDYLTQWHQKNPLLEKGFDVNEFAGKMGYSSDNTGKRYLKGLLQRMNKDKVIERTESTWRLMGHSVKPDPKTLKQLSWLEGELKNYQMQKPVMAEIESSAQSNKITKDRLKMLLTFLAKTNKVYSHNNDYIHSSIVDKCRKTLLHELENKEQGINEKEFRLLINGTKKICRLLLDIYEKENIVVKKSFFIHITEKGKNLL